MKLQDKVEHVLQDKEKYKSQIIALAKDKLAASMGWIVIMAVVAIGLIGYLSQSSKPEEARVQGISISSSTSSAAPKTEVVTLKVDVSGAVNQPGVKELHNGDRVEDALRAAGGIAASADSEYIATNINLAAKLQDGDKIFIPVKGQSVESSTSSTSSQASKTSTASSASFAAGGKVSINRASASELDSLPGIGATYAARIIGGRPYKSVDDLCSRSDVFHSKSICDKIRPLVSL